MGEAEMKNIRALDQGQKDINKRIYELKDVVSAQREAISSLQERINSLEMTLNLLRVKINGHGPTV